MGAETSINSLKVTEVASMPSSVTVGTGVSSYRITLPASAGTLATEAQLTSKQDTLVSGTNIRTINGQSLLGAGNLSIVADPAIDNQTIIKNTSNALKTAIGGYSETVQRNYTIIPQTSGAEWDLYDATDAASLFALNTNTRYDCMLSGPAINDDCEITAAWLYFTNKDSTELGTGENALHITFTQGGSSWDGTFEFYVMNENGTYPNRIHIYSGNSNPFKWEGGDLYITGLPLTPTVEEVVHKVDSKYIPPVAINPNGYGLNVNKNDQLELRVVGNNGIIINDSST